VTNPDNFGSRRLKATAGAIVDVIIDDEVTILRVNPVVQAG
jgi:hypothetical protein